MRCNVLTVVTLTIPGREASLERLCREIARQSAGLPVQHLVHSGPNRYGTEMRRSLERAPGTHVSYVDDDDFVEPSYVADICAALESDPDVVTFGSFTPGCPPCWLRANRGDNSGTPEEGNVKTANHYCAWRKTLAMSSPWLPRNYGAEYIWYTALNLANPGLREVHVPKCLHVYLYNAAETRCQDRESIGQSLANGGNRILICRHVDGTLLAGPSFDALQRPDGAVAAYKKAELVVLREVEFK